MDRYLERISAYMEVNRMVPRGGQVVLGLSGGPDSVFLLHALCALRGPLDFELSCVHVNHGIRGEEAERDQDFCMELCTGLDLPCTAVQVDAPSCARREHLSLEEAGRRLRYQVFEEVRAILEEDSGLPAVIAVGHHANDQAETVLHNLIRGTGLRGIGGMEAVKGRVIRPLLCMERSELAAWLSERGLRYMTDGSNADLAYTRNRIRAELIPAAEAVNAQAVRHISQTAALAAEADAWFRRAAQKFVEQYAQAGGAGCVKVAQDQAADAFAAQKRVGTPTAEERTAEAGAKTPAAARGAGKTVYVTVPLAALRREEPLLRRYIFMELVERLGAALRDWGARHFADLDALLEKQGGAHLDLPCRVSADKRGKQLILRVNSEVLSMQGRRAAAARRAARE